MTLGFPDIVTVFSALTVAFAIAAFLMGLNGVLREGHRVRKLGISREQPRCSNCDYVAVGWTQPICPECGEDVSERGVQIGPRSTSAWVYGIVQAAVICYGLPGLIFAAAILPLHRLTLVSFTVILVVVVTIACVATRILAKHVAALPTQGYAQPSLRSVNTPTEQSEASV